MRNIIHVASIVVFACIGASFLASANDFVEAEAELVNKCCKPATPKKPTGGGCTTECTDTPQICAFVLKAGSWNPGDCKKQKESTCSEGAQPVPTPNFSCGLVPCKLEDGTDGKKCDWVVVSFDADNTKKVNVCSGTPCAG